MLSSKRTVATALIVVFAASAVALAAAFAILGTATPVFADALGTLPGAFGAMLIPSVALLSALAPLTVEFAALSLAAAVLVFLCILPQIETLTSTFREWAGLSGMPEVFGALLKALGIVLIGRITADLCKDAGESAIASGVELAVKTAVLLTALPFLNRLLSLLQEVLLL